MQSIARRRLDLTGEVEFVQKDGPDGRILAASAQKSSLEMKHVVLYSNADSLDPADVYHEMCRAKLYELGFKGIENVALMAIKDCAGDDPKYIFDANSAIVIVSEVYTSLPPLRELPGRIREQTTGDCPEIRVSRCPHQPSYTDGILGYRRNCLLQTRSRVGWKEFSYKAG